MVLPNSSLGLLTSTINSKNVLQSCLHADLKKALSSQVTIMCRVDSKLVSTEGRNSRKAGTWKQELKQKAWRSATTDLFSLACSAYLFFFTTQDHIPGVVIIHRKLGHPTSAINQTIDHRLPTGQSD